MKVYYHKIFQTIYTYLRRNDNKKSHFVVLLADSYNKIKVFSFEVIFANISQNFIKSLLLHLTAHGLYKEYEPLREKNRSLGFPTRSNTNRVV